MTLYNASEFTALLEKGVKKDSQPQDLTMFGITPVNAVTGKAYRGDSRLRLQDAAVRKGYTAAEWSTEKQWHSLGHQIADGQKPTRIDFVEVLKADDGAQQRTSKYGFLYNCNQLAEETPTPSAE